jgi:hypothetical protein
MQPGEHDTLATSTIPGSARPSRRAAPTLPTGGAGGPKSADLLVRAKDLRPRGGTSLPPNP